MASLTIAAEPAGLPAVQAFVDRVAREAGLDARASYRLALAVEELTVNIVQHGYVEQGLQGDLAVRSELYPDRLVLILEDRGVPFDPTHRALPSAADLALPLEERSIGGLGIFLALRGLDGFRYERGAGLNRNILEMRRP